jgi:hypothetical protein
MFLFELEGVVYPNPRRRRRIGVDENRYFQTKYNASTRTREFLTGS